MNKKRGKRITAVFLSVVTSLSLYTTPVFAENIQEPMPEETVVAEENVSGTYGNITWEVTGETLKISGSGSCRGYDDAPPPWGKEPYGSSIKKAEVYATGITDAENMFSGCKNLTEVTFKNQKANETSLRSMRRMFYGCTALKKVDFGDLNTQNVTDMEYMFVDCKNLQELNLSKFNAAKVTNMRGMFYGCSALKKITFGSNFTTNEATDMSSIFCECKALTNLDLSMFHTSKVKNMTSMFWDCNALQSIQLSNNFKTNNVTTMHAMFNECKKLQSVDISKFNTAKVTDMSNMFSGCSSMESLNLSGFNTSNVTDMYSMFCDCDNLKSLDVSKFNTAKVTNMRYMFYHCSSLENLNVSGFNTASVTMMDSMFAGCSNLKSLPVEGFNTQNVKNMSGMFASCGKLESLNLGNFRLDKATSMEGMVASCDNLKYVTMPKSVNCDVLLPNGTWYDEDGVVRKQVLKNLSTTMTYGNGFIPNRTSNSDNGGNNNGNQNPGNGGGNTASNKPKPIGTKVASYNGYDFYLDAYGTMRCYDAEVNLVKNDFKCDGTYTYYFQNDGTDMKDRLTYHPDGAHIIYFDENGHEVFNNFAHVKKSIEGNPVDDLCFFDVYGYMYTDVITYDQSGTKLYYANPYGVMERNGWFLFSEKQGGGKGYANPDGTLLTNQFSYDEQGRLVYFQGDGKLARGLISDGVYYYDMDLEDGHCLGQFPVQ